MKIKLFIKSKASNASSGAFEWERDNCLIGRKGCEVRLSDPACSRQHALLYSGPDGRLRIKDLRSTNGTFLRGKAVGDTSLRVGDEVRIGDCIVIVLAYDPVKASPPPDLPSILELQDTDEGSFPTSPRYTRRVLDHEGSFRDRREGTRTGLLNMKKAG